MDDPKARALFEDDAASLEDAEIIGASVGDDYLTLQINGGFPDGRYAVQIRAIEWQDPETEEIHARLEFDFDEPKGAGDDPYGRPDPRTHPEFWRE